MASIIRISRLVAYRNIEKFTIRNASLSKSVGITAIRGLSVASTSPSIGETIANLSAENPNKELVRYEHKNLKFNLKLLEENSEALAIGLLETGLQAGDAMLSWLPLHFAEHHILQLACSKAGFILYHLDPSLAISDKKAAKDSLKNALEMSEATCLFSQQAGSDVNYIDLIKDIIPEIRYFDIYEGMPFFTPHFPHLRFPIHTGFDVPAGGLLGMLPYKYMMVPVTGHLRDYLKGAKLSGSTPLMGELILDTKDGSVKKGKVLTNDQVLESNAWPEVCSMVKREFIEVEGIGVVF